MLDISDEPLPELARADYAEFRNRIFDLPEDYDDWRELSDDQERQSRRGSKQVRMFALTPAEFDLYWRDRRSDRRPTMHDLVLCARDKAHGYGPTQSIDEVNHYLDC